MALPRVASPTYELTVPSTGQKVKYRPFLVKEEKTLLMAMESGDNASMTKAMLEIITSCTEGGVKIKDLSPYDIEYFLFFPSPGCIFNCLCYRFCFDIRIEYNLSLNISSCTAYSLYQRSS